MPRPIRRSHPTRLIGPPVVEPPLLAVDVRLKLAWDLANGVTTRLVNASLTSIISPETPEKEVMTEEHVNPPPEFSMADEVRDGHLLHNDRVYTRAEVDRIVAGIARGRAGRPVVGPAFLMNPDTYWWESPDDSPPRPGTSYPLFRNGGPRDGNRIGTVVIADDGTVDLRFGTDEDGRPLPGWEPGE
jgi:hypothetical protein